MKKVVALAFYSALGLLCLDVQPSLGAQNDSFPKTARLKGVSIPLCAQNQSKPSILVLVDSIFPDYERRGFFRIGALPILVADSVRIEVLDTNHLVELLSSADTWLKAWSGNKPVVWRQVSFYAPSDPAPVLKSKRARMGKTGQLFLDEVKIRRNSTEIAVRSVILQASGPEAGHAYWTSGGTSQKWNIFSPPSPSTAQQISDLDP